MSKHLRSNAVTPVSDESFDAIVSAMEVFCSLGGAFKAKLRSFLFEITYKKGYHILNSGAKQSMLWFNLDGLLREITVDNFTCLNQTSWYWFSSTFIYVMPGFFDQEPAQVSIEVVMDTRLVFITYENWKRLRAGYEEAERLIEMIRSHYENERKCHLREINELNTTRRYIKHERNINLLFPSIKLQYIAEYMGMSTDTLGKLRRKFARRKDMRR